MNTKLKIGIPAILAICLMTLTIAPALAGPMNSYLFINCTDGTPVDTNTTTNSDFTMNITNQNKNLGYWVPPQGGTNDTLYSTNGLTTGWGSDRNFCNWDTQDPNGINTGDVLEYKVCDGALCNTTYHTVTQYEINMGMINTTTIILPCGAADTRPDLIVESIDINPSCSSVGDQIFVNQSNVINATVKNIGTGNVIVSDSFDVCFNATNATGVAQNISCVTVTGPLNAGQNTTVSISWTPSCTDYALSTLYPMVGLNCTLKVTADCNCSGCPTCTGNGRINESTESNNYDDVDTKVYTNGYKSKNFDCNCTEDPLTQFKYYDFYGGIVYDTAGRKNYPFTPAETDTRNHHLNVPAGMVIEEARLYVYWYGYWSNPCPGFLANLSVNFSGPGGNSIFTTPDALYSDNKGWGGYNYPRGTYAYNVTSLVQSGSNDCNVIIENINPTYSTTLLGELLLIVYSDPTSDPSNKVQLWVLEGNDLLSGRTRYGSSTTEATATVAFPGAITNPGSVSSAILTTVVAQGMSSGSNMLLNGAIVKSDAWDGPTEADPKTSGGVDGTRVNVEEMDFASIMAASGNNMGFQDTGTSGMQPSNAFLIVSEAPRPMITNPSDGDTITGTVWINETTNATDVVYNRFEYYYDADCDGLANDGNSWMLIGNDTNGADGWAVQWDTTLLTTGCYLIRATMGDSQGLTGTDEISVNAGTPVEIAVDPTDTTVLPQGQFDVNVTSDPKGRGIFGIQYTLTYDTSILKAESQVTRDFFNDPSIVVINEIDNKKGTVTYAATLAGNTSCEYTKGTIATIQFTAIGEPNETSDLTLSDVITIDCDKEKTDYIIENGTAHIYSNLRPNIECVKSTHEKNNAAKKFACDALLCVNVTNPLEELGWNISYVRWSFGDGQYGTAEGDLPCDPSQGVCCNCKNHSYISWNYNASCLSLMPRDLHGQPHEVCYDPFNASVTVTDDGNPALSHTAFFDVWVFMAGDANGDAKVNILDAVWIGKHFNEECDGGAACCDYKWSSNQPSGADLNNDCKINILDAVIVGTLWGHTAY